MKPRSQEVHKQHAFDAYCKSVLKHEVSMFYRERQRRKARFCSLNDLSQTELDRLSVTDDYPSDYQMFVVHGYVVPIKSENLAQALSAIPARKRNIALLAYYVGMTDDEIGGLLRLSRSTVQFHRAGSLKELKKLLTMTEGHDNG